MPKRRLILQEIMELENIHARTRDDAILKKLRALRKLYERTPWWAEAEE